MIVATKLNALFSRSVYVFVQATKVDGELEDEQIKADLAKTKYPYFAAIRLECRHGDRVDIA